MAKLIDCVQFKLELQENNYMIGNYIGIIDNKSKSWSLTLSLGINFYQQHNLI